MATVTSEAKNVASVMFFKITRHIEASGHISGFNMYYVFSLSLKIGDHSLSLLGRLLQSLFVVELQQCFED